MMKKFISIATLSVFISVIFCAVTSNATAATEEEINTAIDNGLAWLSSVQDLESGAWHYMDDGTMDLYTDVALTALVVLNFVDRAKENGLDPFDTNQESPTYYKYASNVIAGYDFIFNNASVDLENDRIYFTYSATTYSTGAAMMAVAASNAPDKEITTGELAGKTYQDALQGMMNWMEFAQQKNIRYDCDEGGWDYSDDSVDVVDRNQWADQTNTGYAILGIGFASAPFPAGFGLTIPDSVLTRLNTYIVNVQDLNDGGSWFEPCTKKKWVNILKTGNLLYEMALVGDKLDPERVQNAISYIQKHWNDEGLQSEAEQNFVYSSLGWKDSYQAMFTMTKGLEEFGIGTLNIDGSNINCFEDVSNVIVTNQIGYPDYPPDDPFVGSFDRLNPDIYEGEESTALRTAWALLTLEGDIPEEVKPAPEVIKSVPVYIKPYSCPNPFDFRKHGVLLVAILGTEDFDVTQIDPSSIRLEGVAPLSWSLRDIATPFTPSIGKEYCYEDWATERRDGFKDLKLKFSAQKVAAALGKVQNNECRIFKLTGNLKEKFGGTAIEGEDAVVIQKKGKFSWSLIKKWWHHTRFR
jgi:hypothetical protein